MRYATWFGVGVLFCLTMSVRGEEGKGATPALEALATIAGKWEGDFKIGNNPKATSTSANGWILHGRFLQSEVTSRDAQGKAMKVLLLWGHDEGTNEYTRSYFFSSGGELHERGKFDALAKTFTFTQIDYKSGEKRVSTVTKKDDDTLAWKMTFFSAAGVQTLEVTGENRRVK